MFKEIDIYLIKELAALPSTYSRGEDYFRQGRVRGFFADKNCIQAEVRGTRSYHVKIEDYGDYFSTACNCPAANHYGGLCKHMVAVLLTFLAQVKEQTWDFGMLC